MTATYSIAEARDQFAALIRQVEQKKQAVQVTRRGEPVAVILSAAEYEWLRQSQQDFWHSYLSWRQTWQVEEWAEDSDPFTGIRDLAAGREVPIWD